MPPLPANYWQRESVDGPPPNCMAADLTYARPTTRPVLLLMTLRDARGPRRPAAIQSWNPLMVGRHVNAAVLTRLRPVARPGSPLAEENRTELTEAATITFPSMVKRFLFRGRRQTSDNTFRRIAIPDRGEQHQADLLRVESN